MPYNFRSGYGTPLRLALVFILAAGTSAVVRPSDAKDFPGAAPASQLDEDVANWLRNGPEGGGTVESLAVARRDADIAYAGVRSVGLFRSLDSGSTWEEVLSHRDFRTVALAPNDPDTVYAGTGSGIFKSTDGGASWSPSNDGIPEPLRLITALAIDPVDTSTLYAGTGGGLFKSVDAAGTWRRLDVLNARVSMAAVDPVDSAVVYATQGNVFWKSVDRGESWFQLDLGVREAVVSLAIDSTDPNTLYAGTLNSGVFKSVDGGASWTQLGPDRTWVSALLIDAEDSAIVYAGTRVRGLLKSTDAGNTWTRILASSSVEALAATSEALYTGTAGGVFSSSNDGDSWARSYSGLPYAAILNLTIDPNDSSLIYAGTTGTLFKSTDRAASWSQTNLLGPNVYATAVHPTDPASIYAGVSDGVVSSADGGTSWSYSLKGERLEFDAVGDVAIDKDGPAILYAAALNHGVHKTFDGGASWTQLAGFPGTIATALTIDPNDRATLYAIAPFFAPGSADRLYKSVDGGNTWDEVFSRSSSSLSDIAVDPSDSNTLYLATRGVVPEIRGTVMKSTDGGANWTSTGLALDATAVAVDPTNPLIIYAGTLSSLFRSVDGAATWHPFTTGLPIVRVNAIVVDPSGRHVHAATSAGVFTHEYPNPAIPAPTEWTFCAAEGDVCAFTGTAEVRYGANGVYAYRTVADGTACTNDVFGDPLYGTVKACAIRIPPAPTEWTFCAAEGDVCAFTGTAEVRYGANGVYVYQTLLDGTACTNQVFGDSLHGVVKFCDLRTASDSPRQP